MILSSVTYLIFVGVCLVLQDILPRKFRNFWLLLASVGFFLYAMPAQMPVLLLFCLGIYGIGSLLGKAPARGKKLCLILGVAACVGFLVFYKYLGFLAKLLGLPAESGLFSLVVPMGISYVTFQCVSYLVEIYKGRLAPEESPVDFLVYCLFFAKLTAGPIEAPGAFLAQLKQERTCSPGDARKGISRMLMGFLKKIAVADFAAVGVNAVFAAGDHTGWSVILAGGLYAIQIFFDFSGYTDIARGSAALFGIRLTENFDSPYSAVSVRDFWRRWHISLSTWLRNYIYIPLGGSRVGTVRRYLNILITFLVSGIWHGASWTFVFWGALHGLYQMVEIALDPVGKNLRRSMKIPEDSPLHRIPARIWTFVRVAVAFLFFRAESIGKAFAMLGSLLGNWGSPAEAMTLCSLDLSGILLLAAGIFSAGQMKKLLDQEGELPKGTILWVSAAVIWAVFLVYMVCAASGNVSSFIYFEF